MSLFRRLPVQAWMIALAGALVYLTVDTSVRIRHLEQFSGVYGVMVDPPAVDPASPTGFALGRRTLLYPDCGLDSLHWVMQTQAMFATGTARIRHVDYDNAPSGREVHWAAPFHWWLALLAWADHAVTGAPVGLAVERAALYADPLLLALVLVGLVPLTAKRFGSRAATLMAAAMVAAFPFYSVFVAGYADHHGIAETCALMTVLFLLAGGAGLTRSDSGGPAARSADERTLGEWLPDRRTARAWFAASAVAGGVGLWVSAASQVPVLVGVGAGAVCAAWVARAPGPGSSWTPDPGLWRWWGWVGGAASLLAYLIEYFPDHMTLRLEVNHPLYALAWAGAGEVLCRIARLAAGQRPAPGLAGLGGWLGGVAAVGLLPAVVLATKDRSFFVADDFVWRLHTHFIAEFQSLARVPFNLGVVANCLPVVLIVPALYFVCRPTFARAWRAQLALVLPPAALMTVMASLQVRWWGINDGMLFALVAVGLALIERLTVARQAAAPWFLGGALAFLPGAAVAVSAVWHPAGLTEGEVQSLAERDLAHWLRLRAGSDPVVVLTSPVTATKLIYYGGLSGLGTLYWENKPGLEHAAEIFAANSPEQARALVRRYGVTHIVLVSWSVFSDGYVQLYRGLPPGRPLPENTFIHGLLQGESLPAWLRLIPYRLPEISSLKGQTVLVYEVVPDQSPEAAAIRLADYLVEMERPDGAAGLEPVLARYPQSLPALTTLAYLQGRSGQADRFAATLQRLLGQLPAASGLALEDRVRLAFVLAAGERPELAREQLRAALAQLDERRLRRLTPGTLRDLLVLTDKLGLRIAEPRLGRLAIELLPPVLRAGS